MAPDRRAILKTMGAIGGASLGVPLAGCAGGQGGTTERPTDEPADTPASTSMETPEPTGTPTPTPTTSVTVSAREHEDLGRILADADGRTLYMFVPDGEGRSVCTGGCAEAWPPLTVESEDALDTGSGVTARLGTTEREDGSLQVTADGMPLYYFVRDEDPGDATGQEVGNVWFVLRPDGTVLEPTVSVREHEELGTIVTDADGRTLYMFVPDEEGRSVCTGGCAEAWPPLTVESEDDLFDSVMADVELGTTEREDGSLQVTADGMPLYYFVRDEEPGDAAGQEVGTVWFVLRPDGSVLEPTVSVREHEELGEIITDADGMTLYIFTNDGPNESVCTGGCAEAWPPLTVESGGDLFDSVMADVGLGTTEREDGSLQVTANGMPLYYFAQDGGPGDVKGQGVNDVWFVLRPDGSVVRTGTGG